MLEHSALSRLILPRIKREEILNQMLCIVCMAALTIFILQNDVENIHALVSSMLVTLSGRVFGLLQDSRSLI